MKHFLFLFFIIFAHAASAQDTSTHIAPIDSLEFSETQPQLNYGDPAHVYGNDIEFFINFPGGEKAQNKFIQKHIKFKGTDVFTGSKKAVVIFTVDEEGQISNVSVNEDLDPLIKEQVMAMMHKMPTWKWDIKEKFRRRKVRKKISITIT